VGSIQGAEAATLIDLDSSLVQKYTHSLSIAELARVYHVNGDSFTEDLNFIRTRSKVLTNIKQGTALRAAQLRNQLVPLTRGGRSSGIGTVDCLLLAVALGMGARVISGDTDFEVISFPERYGRTRTQFEFTEGVQKVQLADYVYFLGGT